MSTPDLLSPLQIGPLTARNRLWLPPMCMYSAQERDGVATDWHVLHYGTRAVGGFGTVIVEATAVTPEGRLSEFDLGLWDDAQIEGHRRIVAAIHDGGALAGVQLGHGGRKAGTPPWRPDAAGARAGTLEGWDLVAPSAIAYPGQGHAVPRELDEAGIARLVEAFAQAARRAVAAGYDLIEIHGAHGYLVHQFLSPLSNTRSDAFGGDEAGRRRFPLQVVAAVRHAIDDAGSAVGATGGAEAGTPRALGIRLSATDWAEGGLTGQDTARLAVELAAAGVDAIHVSTGGNAPGTVPVGPGYQVPYAAQARAALAASAADGGPGAGVVVAAVGMIDSAAEAEAILTAGDADAIAVGRPALRDPYLPARWAHELGVDDWREAGLPVQYWRGAWR
ncbi:NADH:flavin oxidoreductase/NADH oxidase [Actinomyces timonensis]|uniref:NADH:flavin oxidoreductase/NADH oxidase n=1 Tax=Actinomyces timonensis TaxID=1288391 RepID=A0AAU8N388_9ACTO